jgi:acetoin utilization protein AcuB
MTPEPVTIDAATSINDAQHLMSVIKIRHLPVVDGKKVIGMLSDRDVRGFASEATFAERSVGSIIDGEVFSVEPSTSLQTLADTMIEHHVGALVVVDHQTEAIVGIVSYVDVLRALKLCLQ